MKFYYAPMKVSRFTYTEIFMRNYLEKSINITEPLKWKEPSKQENLKNVLPEHNEGLHIVRDSDKKFPKILSGQPKN